MRTSKPLLRVLFAGATLLAACATAPRARPETSQRVPDSAPDKVAAQRASAGLHLEEEDDRWGFTAARELRRKKEPKGTQRPAPPMTPGPTDGTPQVDPGPR